jgi:hypothetical protein
MSESEAAALRALLSAPHMFPGAEAPSTTMLQPGFVLEAGPHRFDLRFARPDFVNESIVLPGGTGTITPATPQQSPEIPLRAVPPPESVADAASFQSAPSASLIIEGAPEHHFLPLTGAFSTRDWFYKTAGTPPRVGMFKAANIVRRARDVFVLDAPFMRMVLTRHGALHGAPPASARPPYAAGVSREGDHFFLAAGALDAAPRLNGPHALPPSGPSALLDTMLPLVMLAPFLTPLTRLLLPTDKGAGWPAWLALFGLDGMDIAQAPATLCRVEDLIWPDACAPGQLSAAILNDARARAHATLGPAPAGRLLFISAGLASPDRLANVAAAFSYERHDTLPDDPAARASLFAGAQAVVAAHGPALENILFCPAGAHVVELTPDHSWQPTYNALSDRLGHSHAVLPCAADPQGAGLAPEPQALRRLLRVMAARQRLEQDP